MADPAATTSKRSREPKNPLEGAYMRLSQQVATDIYNKYKVLKKETAVTLRGTHLKEPFKSIAKSLHDSEKFDDMKLIYTNNRKETDTVVAALKALAEATKEPAGAAKYRKQARALHATLSLMENANTYAEKYPDASSTMKLITAINNYADAVMHVSLDEEVKPELMSIVEAFERETQPQSESTPVVAFALSDSESGPAKKKPAATAAPAAAAPAAGAGKAFNVSDSDDAARKSAPKPTPAPSTPAAAVSTPPAKAYALSDSEGDAIKAKPPPKPTAPIPTPVQSKAFNVSDDSDGDTKARAPALGTTPTATAPAPNTAAAAPAPAAAPAKQFNISDSDGERGAAPAAKKFAMSESENEKPASKAAPAAAPAANKYAMSESENEKPAAAAPPPLKTQPSTGKFKMSDSENEKPANTAAPPPLKTQPSTSKFKMSDSETEKPGAKAPPALTSQASTTKFKMSDSENEKPAAKAPAMTAQPSTTKFQVSGSETEAPASKPGKPAFALSESEGESSRPPKPVNKASAAAVPSAASTTTAAAPAPAAKAGGFALSDSEGESSANKKPAAVARQPSKPSFALSESDGEGGGKKSRATGPPPAATTPAAPPKADVSHLIMASKCKVRKLENGSMFQPGERNAFTIVTYDDKGEPLMDGGAAFHVSFDGPRGIVGGDAAVGDNEDGTYAVTFSLRDPGKYAMIITLGEKWGDKVGASPYQIIIAGGKDAPAKAPEPTPAAKPAAKPEPEPEPVAKATATSTERSSAPAPAATPAATTTTTTADPTPAAKPAAPAATAAPAADEDATSSAKMSKRASIVFASTDKTFGDVQPEAPLDTAALSQATLIATLHKAQRTLRTASFQAGDMAALIAGVLQQAATWAQQQDMLVTEWKRSEMKRCKVLGDLRELVERCNAAGVDVPMSANEEVEDFQKIVRMIHERVQLNSATELEQREVREALVREIAELREQTTAGEKLCADVLGRRISSVEDSHEAGDTEDIASTHHSTSHRRSNSVAGGSLRGGGSIRGGAAAAAAAASDDEKSEESFDAANATPLQRSAHRAKSSAEELGQAYEMARSEIRALKQGAQKMAMRHALMQARVKQLENQIAQHRIPDVFGNSGAAAASPQLGTRRVGKIRDGPLPGGGEREKKYVHEVDSLSAELARLQDKQRETVEERDGLRKQLRQADADNAARLKEMELKQAEVNNALIKRHEEELNKAKEELVRLAGRSRAQIQELRNGYKTKAMKELEAMSDTNDMRAATIRDELDDLRHLIEGNNQELKMSTKPPTARASPRAPHLSTPKKRASMGAAGTAAASPAVPAPDAKARRRSAGPTTPAGAKNETPKKKPARRSVGGGTPSDKEKGRRLSTKDKDSADEKEKTSGAAAGGDKGGWNF